MADRPLRDRRGRAVRTFSATEAKNAFGRVLECAQAKGMAVISRSKRPHAVVLSLEEYEALANRPPDILPQLQAEFGSLVQRMQSPEAKAAGAKLFAARPAALGRAAARSARSSD